MKRLPHLFICLTILLASFPSSDTSAQRRRRKRPPAPTRPGPEPSAAFQDPPSPEHEAALKLHSEVLADAFDDNKLKAYKESLPRDGEYYVVEGDILLTETEILPYLVGLSAAPAPTQREGELLLARRNGVDDVYVTEPERLLTYAVDRKSFPTENQYVLVRNNMRVAARRWESVCPECKIVFKYLPERDDASPLPSESLNFVVRYHDSRGGYIASAFYPHKPASERHLKIDPSYFTTPHDRVGILRHELGHVLGYRHEHIRAGAHGCYYQERNKEWRELSPYDSNSVMHYPCGANSNPRMELTAVDINSHRYVYNELYKLR